MSEPKRDEGETPNDRAWQEGYAAGVKAQGKGLIPLDKNNMREIIFNPGECLSVPKNIQELNDFMDFIFDRTCSKFGTPSHKEVKLGLNRDILAKLIFANISIDEKNYGEIKLYGLEVAWSRLPKWNKDFFLNVADAIKSNEATLFEVVK